MPLRSASCWPSSSLPRPCWAQLLPPAPLPCLRLPVRPQLCLCCFCSYLLCYARLHLHRLLHLSLSFLGRSEFCGQLCLPTRTCGWPWAHIIR